MLVRRRTSPRKSPRKVGGERRPPSKLKIVKKRLSTGPRVPRAKVVAEAPEEPEEPAAKMPSVDSVEDVVDIPLGQEFAQEMDEIAPPLEPEVNDAPEVPLGQPEEDEGEDDVAEVEPDGEVADPEFDPEDEENPQDEPPPVVRRRACRPIRRENGRQNPGGPGSGRQSGRSNYCAEKMSASCCSPWKIFSLFLERIGRWWVIVMRRIFPTRAVPASS